MQIIIEKIEFRIFPYINSPVHSKIFHFGDIVKGIRTLNFENDYDYLEILWTNLRGYIPLLYLAPYNEKEEYNSNSFPLPINFKPNHLVKIPHEFTIEKDILVTKETSNHLLKLLNKAKEDKIDLKVISGYLDIKRQSAIFKKNYEKIFKQNLPEKPCFSIYHGGNVIDLSTNEINYNLHPLFFKTKAYKWLCKNAYIFNFKLTEPLYPYIFENNEILAKTWKPWQLKYNGCNKFDKVDDIPKKVKLTSINNSLFLYSIKNKFSKIKYLFIHDNEHTARKTSRYALHQYGGKLFEFLNGNNRNLHLSINNKLIFWDPNRMFTSHGLKDNLIYLNNKIGDKDLNLALKKIKSISKKFIKIFSPKKNEYIIAIHTNNKFSDLTINRFLEDDMKNSFLVYSNKLHNPKNFFYTIYLKDFLFFKKMNYNVVLQKTISNIDDGSLSIFFHLKNYNYISLEVEEGSYSIQKKMVHLVIQRSKQKLLYFH